ncbi:endo alpha-1,4 polygalactosaminidase [Bacterioplanes sanyensis]|uniref:endo alpha-1,4 polygalactosaminidase n=1 Tax=Bacterioplanes sanyensis TaxID=1249553 RepID=UPI001E43DE3B|nr:endo alpha-1,4 polygalactosaminidase [Bacterioplanes sanyensis]
MMHTLSYQGWLATILLCGGLFGCGGNDSDTRQPTGPDATSPAPEVIPQPPQRVAFPSGLSWQWQLSGTVNTGYEVDVYDLDLFDTPASTIADLKASGRKVVCYFSAGSWEEWRDDADQFPPSALGNTLDGWEDEKWLDIRRPEVLTIMQARLDVALDKGCDAVEPDNVDGYSNNNGLGLTASDQLSYNQALAQAAHARNLAIGLKNNLDQVAELEPLYDFAVNEQCHEYQECDVLTAFSDNNKAVFNAEYKETYIEDEAKRQTICERSVTLGISSLFLPLDLDDSFRLPCP